MTETLEPGETYSVEYLIDNLGDQQGTQTVELRDGGTVLDSEQRTLAAGTEGTGTLSWTPQSEQTTTLTLATDDESVDLPVEVVVADFEVSITGTNSPVQASETVTVTADVTNNGGQDQVLDVVRGIPQPLLLNPFDTETVTVAAGATETVTLEWYVTDGLLGGEYTLTVLALGENVSDTTTATVISTPGVTIDDFEDGDLDALSPWGTWSQDLTTTTADPLAGTTSGLLVADASIRFQSAVTRSTRSQPDRLSALVNIAPQTGDASKTFLRFIDTQRGIVRGFEFDHFNGGIELESESGDIGQWSGSVTYRVDMLNIDWTTGDHDIEITDIDSATTVVSTSRSGFFETDSGVDRVEYVIESTANQTIEARIDNVTELDS